MGIALLFTFTHESGYFAEKRGVSIIYRTGVIVCTAVVVALFNGR
jgi:hypothetical protein